MTREPKARYTSFESALHELVHKQIDQVLLERAVNLMQGSARKEAAAETAAAYHEEIGYCRALRDAQQICDDIARQLSRDG